LFRVGGVPKRVNRLVERPDVLTICAAAKALGLTLVTLPRWDAPRKFAAHRHPVSRYRLYRGVEVLKSRRRIDGSKNS
jgi:hypothetical protein